MQLILGSILGHRFCIVNVKLIYKETVDCTENLKYHAVCQSIKETNAVYILSNTIVRIF